MRCHLTANGRITFVEFLKGQDDVEWIAESKLLFDKIGKQHGADGFEVWDGSRIVFRFQEDGAQTPTSD